MREDIVLSGMTTVPSDFACKDGQTAICMNMLPEYAGEIHPLCRPKVLMEIPIGYKFLFVHETSGFKHYIFQASETDKDGNAVKDFYNYYYVEADNLEADFIVFDKHKPGIKHVNAIGNTLITFSESEKNYYLWKFAKYKPLGGDIPEINLQFGLIGEPILYSREESESKGREVHFDFEVWPNDKTFIYKHEYLTEFSNLMLAPVNLLIKNHVTDKGKFCFPFFVRYAIRLYDGTLVHHSAPILMLPASYNAVMPFLRSSSGSGGKLTDCKVDVFLIRSSLTYNVLDNITKAFKDDWGDIVKSVDVYISQPLYTFNADGVVDDITFTNIKNSDYAKTDYVGKLREGSLTYDRPSSTTAIGVYHTYYGAFNYVDVFNTYAWRAFIADEAGEYGMVDAIGLPAIKDDDMKKKIESVSSFYLLKSINLSELINARTNSDNGIDNEIDVADDYLQSLVNREVMTDDYLSHDYINADYSYFYNGRLNLAGIRRTLYDGYPVKSQFCSYEGKVTTEYKTGGGIAFNKPTKKWNVDNNFFVATVEDGGKLIKLFTGDDQPIYISEYDRIPTMFCYPNAGVKDVVWWRTGQSGTLPFMQLEAKLHDFLNLSYVSLYYDKNKEQELWNNAGGISTDKGSEDKTVSDSSLIYTSKVDNPFYFPSSGINSIGVGEVIGMAAAVQALSQGQFGQFPLYAFTSDGVWALSVGTDGNYQTVSPVSRDIASGAIISLDRCVLFTTKRGVMMLSGSQTECITDVLRNDNRLDLSKIGIDKLCKNAGITYEAIPAIGFLDYLEGSSMVYDYTRQRVIVFNNNYSYNYVFSLISRQWSCMESSLQYSVNSYPEGLAIAKKEDALETTLVNLSEDGEMLGGLIATRPLKLNNNHLLSTINHIIVRGLAGRRNIDLALFGTRDYNNYELVGSSNRGELSRIHGTGYKAFVVVIVANLDSVNDYIDILSVDYQVRQNNRMR